VIYLAVLRTITKHEPVIQQKLDSSCRWFEELNFAQEVIDLTPDRRELGHIFFSG